MMNQRSLTRSTIDKSVDSLQLAKCAVSLGYIQSSMPSHSVVAVLFAEHVGPDDTDHSAECSNMCAARALALMYVQVHLKMVCPSAIRQKQVATLRASGWTSQVY